MRIDLFEFIDGLFRGIVYFFYNLIGTAFMVLRHPMRGPALLHRAHQSKTQKQVGGLTFLFITFFVAFALFLAGEWGGSESTTLDYMSGVLSGSFDTNWWWTVFLASFTGTVLVDATLRLTLRWRFGGRGGRGRQAMLAKAEYALFLPAFPVALLLFPLAAPWYRSSLFGDSPPSADLPYLIPVFLFACAAAAPAAAQLGGPRLRPRQRNRWARAVSVSDAPLVSIAAVARMLGLGTLVTAASLLAATAGGYRRIDESINRQHVRVVALTCHLREDRPYVDAVLHNRGRSALPVDPGDMVLHLGRMRLDEAGGGWVPDAAAAQVGLRSGADAYGSPTVIEPGATAVVRGWLSQPVPPGLGFRDRCLLEGSAVGLDGGGQAQFRIAGEAGAIVYRIYVPEPGVP